MNRSVVVCLSAALLAAPLSPAETPKAGSTKPAAARVVSERPVPATDSPLVRAAKAARKAREKKASSGPVITDDSVKKSGGRLTVLSGSARAGTPAPEDAEAAFVKMNQDRADAAMRAEQARVEAEGLVKEIARLERELASVEEDYYDESNLELRDDVAERDFKKTKTALETAREKLAAARKRQQEFARASSNVVKP